MSNPTIPNNYAFSARSAHAMAFSYYLLFGVWMLAEGMADLDKGTDHILLVSLCVLSFASLSLFYQSLFFSYGLAVIAVGCLLQWLHMPICRTAFHPPIWIVFMNLVLAGLFIFFCFSYISQSRKKLHWLRSLRLFTVGALYYVLYAAAVAGIYYFNGKGWNSVSEHLFFLIGLITIYFLARIGLLPGTRTNIYIDPEIGPPRQKYIFGNDT